MAYNTKFYTKHYNIESDRVVSKIGGRFEYSPYPISEHLYNNDIQSLSDNQNKFDSIFLSMMPQHFDSAYVYDDVVVDMISLKNIYSLTLFYKNENDIFWYHKDQLGSSTQITDVNEMVIHHIEYMPYGEAFVEQRSNWGTNYKFNGKELDEETGYYYYGARYYNPDISIWLSVDPLSDKYPNESPYIYVSNNPIIHIDPDGREKIIALNKDKKEDKTIISGAKKYKDDGAIHIFGHGSSKGMTLIIDGKTSKIRSPEHLEAFLSKNSETWQNKGNVDQVTIVLHSCNTGRDNKDGTASFAEKVSESDIFKNAIIIAPNERVYFSEAGETGAYKAKFANEHGEYIRNGNGQIKSSERSNEQGEWRVFKNGKETMRFSGDWKPKEHPMMWGNLKINEE